ncbi:MAG: hypothetical protein V7676_05460 [Parasphingorhabdus sp.]|uniref:hypothetical protein n=1 Tax=Parasphingorhabdus sp. TaxID=2709688 RepID=UPI0030022DEC
MTRHDQYLHNAAAQPLLAIIPFARATNAGAGKLTFTSTIARKPTKTAYHVTGHDVQNRRTSHRQNQPKSEILIA